MLKSKSEQWEDESLCLDLMGEIGEDKVDKEGKALRVIYIEQFPFYVNPSDELCSKSTKEKNFAQGHNLVFELQKSVVCLLLFHCFTFSSSSEAGGRV